MEETKSEFVHTSLIETYFYFILTYLIALNIIAYAIMAYDKFQSKRNGNRIPENTLFIIALIGGALGIYLGMFSPIRHKSAKWKFKIGIPIILILNILSIYFLMKK